MCVEEIFLPLAKEFQKQCNYFMCSAYSPALTSKLIAYFESPDYRPYGIYKCAPMQAVPARGRKKAKLLISCTSQPQAATRI